MTRFSQFAAPVIVGAGLFVGGPGCASDEQPIPARAQLLSEGREMVAINATSEGTVYVYDDTTNDRVYTGRIDAGDTIRVDAKHDRVMLNDKVALERKLQDTHSYIIYFEPTFPEAGTAAHRQGSTVIQNPSGSTVITPAPAPARSGTTVVQPAQPAVPPPPKDTTIVQPDGTVVKPGDSGTTIVTPAR